MIYGEVYCITNRFNDKKYIGVTTKGINNRFKQHMVADSYIGKAIRRHGVENFDVKLLSQADSMKEMFDKEIYYIKKENSFSDRGYNLTIGGEGASNTILLEINLTDRQKKFISYVDKENKKDIDVNNNYEMIKSIIINLMSLYLQSERMSDKKKASKLIAKLKDNYIQAVAQTKVIDFKELQSYL